MRFKTVLLAIQVPAAEKVSEIGGVRSRNDKFADKSERVPAGDLGQTPDSLQTLLNYHEKEGEAVLYVGDLSYADEHPNFDPVKWDTFGRLVERSTAYHPWILAAGNHEVEYGPEIVSLLAFTPSPVIQSQSYTFLIWRKGKYRHTSDNFRTT